MSTSDGEVSRYLKAHSSSRRACKVQQNEKVIENDTF